MNKKTIQLALWILLGLAIIDILNVPSIVINQIQLNFEEISLVGLIIIIGVLLGISYVQWFKTMRTKILEMTDKFPIVLLSIVIFYGIINIMIGYELIAFKFQLLFMLVVMLMCTIALLQMRKQFPNPEVSGNTLQTVFDLHDLYDGNKFVNWNPEQFILLKETTVTKDLLNREQTIVPELKRTITNCYYPEGGFVITLTGSWGSGKTTVINMVTDELKELTLINDFSFWKYENKEALLKAVIERLLEESDSVLNFRERQAFIQSVLEMVSDKSGFNFVRLFANGDELSRAKNKLSTHLIENNKRILFVVDDLERTNSEIAIMIFKVIATVLDIGNVIYLVSYDEVEMKKHFSNVGIEFNYLDKVINQKFTLPQISEANIADETKKAMLSLAQIYGRTDELKNVIDEVAKLLPIENIRDLKRMLNSLMPYIQKNELGLNERDRLLINYIKFKDYGLWTELFENGHYLASFYYVDSRKSKQREEHNVSKGFNPDKETDFEHNRTEWIEKIQADYKQYLDILKKLFNDFKMKGDYTQSIENDRNFNILNGNYFLMYFIEESSDIHQTKKAINQFLSQENIEKVKITAEVEKQAVKELFEQNANQQNAMFLYLQRQEQHFGILNVVILRYLMAPEGDKNKDGNIFHKLVEYCALIILRYCLVENFESILAKVDSDFINFYFHKKIVEKLTSESWWKQHTAEIKEDKKEIINQYHEIVKKQFLKVWEHESITDENLKTMIEIYLHNPDFYGEKTQSEWQTWFQNKVKTNSVVFLQQLYNYSSTSEGPDFDEYAKVLQELGILEQLKQLDIDALKNNYSFENTTGISELLAIKRYQDFIKQQEKGLTS